MARNKGTKAYTYWTNGGQTGSCFGLCERLWEGSLWETQPSREVRTDHGRNVLVEELGEGTRYERLLRWVE